MRIAGADLRLVLYMTLFARNGHIQPSHRLAQHVRDVDLRVGVLRVQGQVPGTVEQRTVREIRHHRTETVQHQ